MGEEAAEKETNAGSSSIRDIETDIAEPKGALLPSLFLLGVTQAVSIPFPPSTPLSPLSPLDTEPLTLTLTLLGEEPFALLWVFPNRATLLTAAWETACT